jgi:hypothetical protein
MTSKKPGFEGIEEGDPKKVKGKGKGADLAGQALLAGNTGKDKGLKHTRFSLGEKGLDMGNEIME